MKRILLTLFIISTAVSAYAQAGPRPFEDEKTSYDPYIAESRGFESLFVNPAGMAGETDIFTWDIEAGTAGARSTYEAIGAFLQNPDMLSGGTTTEDPTPEDLGVILDLLADQINQADLNTLTAGSALTGMTAEQIAIYLNDNELTETDVTAIANNADANSTILENAVTSLADSLKVEVQVSTKLGTLIKGFGLGVYADVYSILDAKELGFEQLVAETGIKLGYGFDLGPFALGASADFAMIGNVASASLETYMSEQLTYGYAWGLDVGATFQPFDWFTVGAVMTDLIGSYYYAGETTLEALMNGTAPATDFGFSYTFDADLDFGVTFTPQLGKLLRPSFSVDYYDFIGLFRNPPSNFQGFMDHMRFGAHIELLTFINLRAMYYQEFFTLGAGVDLLFFEVFGEFKFDQAFEEIGGSVLVKLHF